MGLNGKKVAFIGAGNMAEAIIRGLLKARVVAASDILATGRRQSAWMSFTIFTVCR